MPGIVTDVRVDVGQLVAAGATLVVMEAMKMEHLISAPSSGTIAEVLVHRGQQVDRGAALVVLITDQEVS
jgi:propionyl-CoA carboxylase alpha chain